LDGNNSRFLVKNRSEFDLSILIRFVFPVLLILVVLLILSGWIHAVSGIPIPIIMFASIFLSVAGGFAVFVLSEKGGSLLPNLIFGSGRVVRPPVDKFSADLSKARYNKSRGEYEQALQLLNQVLVEAPDLAEALFLKAQVLWEGFGNQDEARQILERVIASVEENELLYRWASNYNDRLP